MRVRTGQPLVPSIPSNISAQNSNQFNRNSNTLNGNHNNNATNFVKGFDLSDPDNYDLNVIVSLSGYFNNVSLEYFSRILHSYATEILHAAIPEPEKHYYYRSCMNIYGACLYQMFSKRAREELNDYIKKKKKFLNATTKFEIYLNKKKSSNASSSSSNLVHTKKKSHTLTSTAKKQLSSKTPLILSKKSHSSSSSANASLSSSSSSNPISERLQRNIIESEPIFQDFKALRYQSHVLGNIAEGNILDYLFINYIDTSKFVSNLNFVSKCFVSSFDKADSMIKRSSSSSSSNTDSTTTAQLSTIPYITTNSLHNTTTTRSILSNQLDVDSAAVFNAGSNSDGDDLDDVLTGSSHRTGTSNSNSRGGSGPGLDKTNNSSNSTHSGVVGGAPGKKFSRRSSKLCNFIGSSNNDLNRSEGDNTDISSVDSAHSELLH